MAHSFPVRFGPQCRKVQAKQFSQFEDGLGAGSATVHPARSLPSTGSFFVPLLTNLQPLLWVLCPEFVLEASKEVPRLPLPNSSQNKQMVEEWRVSYQISLNW